MPVSEHETVTDEQMERCADAIESVYEHVFLVASRQSTALDFRDRLADARAVLSAALCPVEEDET